MLALRGPVLWACVITLFSMSGLYSISAAHEDHQDHCICDSARVQNGWCTHCDRGFVAALEIQSQDLYEMIDPHGHDMDLAHLPCPECIAAARTDGFCETSKMGFIDGRGYVSLMAYLLAGAEVLHGNEVACGLCRDHLETPGWCARCQRGVLGHFSFHRRKTFDQTQEEYRRLVVAVRKTADCELCGVALFAGGRCPKCNIHYKDGNRLEAGDLRSNTERGRLQ